MPESPSQETFVDPNTDDLDSFTQLLNGDAKEKPEDEVVEVEDDADPESDTDEDAVETDDDSDDTVEEEEPAPEPEQPKKSRYRERIDELSREKHEARREAAELRRMLDEALNRSQTKADDPAPEVKATPEEPRPDEKLENGEDKYPLGEFDPTYIRDLTRHNFNELNREAEAKRQREDQETRSRQEADQLTTEWNGRLETAIQEKYPDFREKNDNLQTVLGGLDEQYGNYLATTIMSMDYGTDVLYHLASHPDEAAKIAAMGATKATVALGRLEATFASEAKDKTQPKKLKVSQAAPPPANLNRGSNVATTVPDDTDDLDLFSQKLFKKR